MSVSVTTPIGQAWERMVQVLFKPFAFGKWCAIGLGVFLAALGQGGGCSFQMPGPGGGSGSGGTSGGASGGASGGGMGGEIAQATAWVEANAALVLGIAAGVLVLVVALKVVFAWLACRGMFMFVDAMATNRAVIGEQWKRLSGPANSAWRFTLWTFGLMGLIGLAAVAGGLVWSWDDLRHGVLTDDGIGALMMVVLVIVPTGVLYWKAQVILQDFIVPMMYAQRLSATRAWGVWFCEFLKGHVWAIILFYLMRIVFGVAIGAVVMFGVCLTCCLAALPYVASVVFLPAFAFDRCYSMYFVQQFGDRWLMLTPIDPGPVCPACRYDLRGNPSATACPECGYRLPPELMAGLGEAPPEAPPEALPKALPEAPLEAPPKASPDAGADL